MTTSANAQRGLFASFARGPPSHRDAHRRRKRLRRSKRPRSCIHARIPARVGGILRRACSQLSSNRPAGGKMGRSLEIHLLATTAPRCAAGRFAVVRSAFRSGIVCRPVFSLWPYFWRALLSFALVVILAFIPFLFLLVVAANPAVRYRLLWRSRWRCLWRLTNKVRRFRTARARRIVLHYAPELESAWDMPVFLQRCQEELDRLTDRFGFRVRGRVVIFLFANHQDIGAIFGANYGGLALPLANAILIADKRRLWESIPHEFAHLFSTRWSALAPPLLSEGLSVWLQGTEGGRSI